MQLAQDSKVVTLKNSLIECTILTGNRTGETVFIPRMSMIPSELSYQLKRLQFFQFLIKLEFGMTINKTQDQTLKVAGIDLNTQCFSQGQLYVALLRVTSDKICSFLQVIGRSYQCHI